MTINSPIVHLALAGVTAKIIVASATLFLSTSNAQAAALPPSPAPAPTSSVSSSSAPSHGGSSNLAARVCFYTEVAFQGQRFCETGLRGVKQVNAQWRDHISSIQLVNGAKIKICNEFDRRGNCETFTSSEEMLPMTLHNKVYSYRITR